MCIIKFIVMGTIRKGILGGFSGKVGTVVGGDWRGISYMRSLPRKIRDPRTPAQMNQRTKFALSVNYLKPMNSVLRSGWKLYANGQSTINAAMSYTIANAITGVYPDYSIDPGKVLISRGGLTSAFNAIAIASNGVIEFVWDDNSGVNDAKQTDKALIAIVNRTEGEAVTVSEGAERKTGMQTIALPARWTGDTVDAYIGFISDDGMEVADSVYLGNILVA